MDLRFALLLSCFFLSGFAALLYQTAWSRELSFVFGTSDLAVAAVLAAYMGGLALGAAAAARVAHRIRRPVLAYGLLELAIAGCALVVPWGIHGLNALYVGWLSDSSVLEEGLPPIATLVQLAGAFAVLLPPTAFMGATLPLLARHAVHREEEIGARVGVLYAVNTTGAIAGTVLAAFWLMPALGLRQTVWAGAALNALVFALAALLARKSPLSEQGAAPRTDGALAAGGFWILPAMLLSGAVSFVYEVLWTRLLGLVLGASIHAFATMLASFLLGIALGSSVAARFATTRARATLGFALAQLGIAAASYLTFTLAERLPELAVRLGAGPEHPLPSAALAGLVLLPVTLCIGATFPFAVRVLAARPEEAAAATARVYSWNTIGAIVGSLSAAFVLLPGFGFEGTVAAGVIASLGLAAAAAIASPARRKPLVAVAVALGAVLVVFPPQTPWRLLTASPLRAGAATGEIVYSAVGRTTTVVVTKRAGRIYLSTDGLPEATVDSKGMLPLINVAHWLSAVPAWVRPDARRLLVVGLGGGVAVEMAPYNYETIDVIELEPKVLEANRAIAAERERDPLADPRVRVHLGDARGTLQLVDEQFDAIVSQPSHPWTAGASHLYTREFFELVRSRLAPGGVFVQWIGMRFVDEPLLKSLLAALSEAFPHIELYRPQFHGLLFVASDQPIDALAGVRRSLAEHRDDLARFGVLTLEDFASRWTLNEAGVAELAAGAVPNTDDHNLLAARSAWLGDDSLDAESARSLFDPRDPLLAAEGLDFSGMMRALMAQAQNDRAIDLARTGDGASEEIGLGWVELAASRNGRAARNFRRALELDPKREDAMEGLIASQRTALGLGQPVEGVRIEDLSPPHAALIASWRLAQAEDWQAVAELEPQLASIPPESALFELATRVRIELYLAMGDVANAETAERLAATLLLRSWFSHDALLHARAAIAAGHPLVARGSLSNLANRVTTRPVAGTQGGRMLAERTLEVARGLPEELEAEIRAQMLGAGGAPGPEADPL